MFKRRIRQIFLKHHWICEHKKNNRFIYNFGPTNWSVNNDNDKEIIVLT